MDRVMGPTTWGTVEHRRRVACDWGLQLMDRVMGPTTWGPWNIGGEWHVTGGFSSWTG